MIKAVIAVVIHLIGFTTMLHERLCDDVRGSGFVYGHSRDLGMIWFIASQKAGKENFLQHKLQIDFLFTSLRVTCQNDENSS